MDNLLKKFREHGFNEDKLTANDGELSKTYVEHLDSFREQLSLGIPGAKKENVSLIDTLHRRREQHIKHMSSELASKSCEQIIEKVKIHGLRRPPRSATAPKIGASRAMEMAMKVVE